MLPSGSALVFDLHVRLLVVTRTDRSEGRANRVVRGVWWHLLHVVVGPHHCTDEVPKPAQAAISQWKKDA